MSRTLTAAPLRALTLALLLCVLAVRVIVPQGYMWASAPGGAPAMVECSGMGPMPGMAMSHGQSHDHDGKTADHPCAFAAAGAAVDLAAEVHPVALRVIAAAAPATLRISVSPGLGLAAPPPPKTGPPPIA